ncbi:hypothetical protein [Saccharomonospora glauca]|jgi:hypothetical protein|uniref:Lipoprotein n=1 Tax=Saccharomonospora glauca K62 TaxID=928724 RepID=I1CXN0_9PSEU|nr:hypothetical protein [Saccharomonospora glauca]EIE97454.1 hypothetical protein SacglDRAFT_00503 [Saccharomonospora glauca K62]
MKQRLRRVIALGAALLLATGCATGRVGEPIPDGDDVAKYVGEKFSSTLERLSEDLGETEPRKSTLHSFMRVGELKSDSTVTAIQIGNPPTRFYKNHSNRNSSDYRDFLLPAGSDVEYMLLGPEYSSLAPTPWVSLPYTGQGLDICFWGGYLTVCRMLSAVTVSMQSTEVDKAAKSLTDGSTELTIDMPLRIFLDERIVVLPDWLLEEIPEALLDDVIDTRILLTPEGDLKEIEMNGLLSDGGNEVEIKQHYQVLEPPSEHEIPDVPSPDEVTELTTDKEVDEFYDRMAEITSSRE